MIGKIRSGTTSAALLTTAIVTILLVGSACGEGGTQVQPEADPDPVAEAAPGQVSDPSEGAQTVNVALAEWSLEPDVSTVSAGSVYFLASNNGAEPHEVLLIRSDLAPDALPTDNGRVPEDDIDIVGEIEPFAADSDASIEFNLEPGNYVLLCNIVEIENDEVESHYENGMYAAFTVE